MISINKWLTGCLLATTIMGCSSQPWPSSVSEVSATSAIPLPAFSGIPDPRDAVIYQVNIRAFSEQGNLKGVEARLDNIKALGVNVVYLMPIYPIGTLKGINSPYSISDYQAVNPEFGNLEDLQSLVKAAHQHNLSVVLDFIPNHTAWDHPWLSQHPSWHLKDQSGKLVNPHGWGDVVQLDFSQAAMRESLIDAMKFWVTHANIDGFRFDYSDGPSVDFWQQAVAELRAIEDHPLLILAEGSRNQNFSAGVDYNFGFGFFDRLKEIFHGEPAHIIDSWQAQENDLANDQQRVVRYTTNHDVNGAEGTPEQVFGNHDAAMTAFVIAAYMRSTPMIYNGQEIALPYPLTFPFTEQNIRWQSNEVVSAQYQTLIALFNQSKALRRGNLDTFSSENLVAFTRQSGDETLLIVANPRDKQQRLTLPAALKNKQWQDLILHKPLALNEQITLNAQSYKILQLRQ